MMTCKNMKRSGRVLGDKYALSGDEMEDGVMVMT